MERISALANMVMNASNSTSLITTASAVPAAGGYSTSRATMQNIARATARPHSTAKGRLKTAAYTSVVDEDKCSGCGTCVEMCAYNAIVKNERGLAEVRDAVCKGCGVCGASCPERAITMRHFTNEELEAQGMAALREG